MVAACCVCPVEAASYHVEVVDDGDLIMHELRSMLFGIYAKDQRYLEKLLLHSKAERKIPGSFLFLDG